MPILILLILAGLFGAPQYFRRFRGTTNRWLYTTAAIQICLLAAAALLASGRDGAAVAWGTAASVAVVAAAIGGGPVTMSILCLSERSAAAELPADGPARDDGQHAREPRKASSTHHTDSRGEVALQGGAWIGVLERTAISVTLWCGWPEGLAIVLAVKGLGRYAELGKDGAAERFILGTFASVLWAGACTGIAVLATG